MYKPEHQSTDFLRSHSKTFYSRLRTYTKNKNRNKIKNKTKTVLSDNFHSYVLCEFILPWAYLVNERHEFNKLYSLP